MKTMNQKLRSSNIELYRIVTMLLIVSHHYVVNSGLTAQDGPLYTNPLAINSLFYFYLGAWGKIGINCFMLITGYFMCESQITVKKFCKLMGQIYLYRFVFFLIFFLGGKESISLFKIFTLIVPFSSISQNFTSCFIAFWLFIPFLNILVHNLTQKQHQALIALCFIVYSLLGFIHTIEFNYVSWFIVLYFFASYIRLYPAGLFCNRNLWGACTIACVAACFVGVYVGILWGHPYFFVTDSNTVLALLTGLCSFLWIKNVNIGYSKTINTIASTTFGILLIHANSDAMRQWLWKDTIDCVGHYDTPYFWLYSIGCIIAVFCISSIIDYIRIIIIEKHYLALVDKLISKYKIK